MSMSHRKIKSVAKTIATNPQLADLIRETMKIIADSVGGTLGPGGRPVLIERQEYGFPNLITKDGVTVFRALGFRNPIQHAIMETARDASVRTASEAGDGTTTATILAEAIVRYTDEFCKANTKVSPQRVVRLLEKIFKDDLEPIIKELATQVKITPEVLRAVAKCSANGDEELATAIMQCFELAGDDGNITILEASGPSGYQVEPLKGYPLAVGFEDSAARFASVFINDRVNSRVVLDKPVFILNFGPINEIQQLFKVIGELGADFDQWLADCQNAKGEGKSQPEKPISNIVLVATGFSESVLGQLASNFSNAESVNVVPVLLPRNSIQNGQLHVLEDLSAVTGSKIFDSIRNPIQRGGKSDIGQPLEYFEMSRYRTNIVGMADEGLLLARVEEVRAQVDSGANESIQDLSILKERLGKLTGGIAKLIVTGASNGEVREKKDRAEDAACAVRGAIKNGALPGGCWTFLHLADRLRSKEVTDLRTDVLNNVLVPALETPFQKILTNCGYNQEEIAEINLDFTVRRRTEVLFENPEDFRIYNALEGKFMDAVQSGVVDSVPAVLEALRSSISVASLLGTMGSVIVYPRDEDLERKEAGDTYEFLKSGGM